jgi:cobalt-zinc-cadmium efflux system membrane fusion protein
MKIMCVFCASIVLWSCKSKDAAASAPAQKEHEAGIIVLDETQQQKAHIRVEPVRAKDVTETVTVPGRLTASGDQTWRVGAIASGRIEDLTVRLGDLVPAGQILGHIHSHEVHEARAGYQQASVELERARSAQAYAQQKRDRAQRLFDLRAGSRQDLETAEAELRNAQAAVEKAQSEVHKERAHLEIFRLPIDEAASEGEQDDIPIPAPASGVIWDRRATVGSVVNAGDELLTLIDTSSLWMIGAANEADLSKLRPDQAVRIQTRAYPGREFGGRILKLGEQLDPATRTLQIRIAVPNPQGLLKPEMYATATLQESARRSAIVLPDEAVQDIDGVAAVFVRRDQHEFETRTVKTGQKAGGETEILEGLNTGEAVVVKGGFLLKSQLLKSLIQEN